MILTQAQAESIYSAMVALNNVNGRINATLGRSTRVAQRPRGTITVLTLVDESDWEPQEIHESQAAFATAYGLNQG